MPSAASAKLEKQISSQPAESTVDNNNANTPIKQALIIIEHKIRNLEKRKTKLECYRGIQSSGKELSSDQKAAVAKYDEVASSLEFARDLSKQMVQLSISAEKEAKKQARKEAVVRAQAETAKIREVLIMQNILQCLMDNSIREDFVGGINGAVKLDDNDLNVIEKFCIDIQLDRQKDVNDSDFLTSAQRIAEQFSFTIDGRPKQYGDSSYEHVRRIFLQIQECGYLDKIFLVKGDIEENIDNSNENLLESDVNVSRYGDVEEAEHDQQQQTDILEQHSECETQQNRQKMQQPFDTEVPPSASEPVPVFPPTVLQQIPQSVVSVPPSLPGQQQIQLQRQIVNAAGSPITVQGQQMSQQPPQQIAVGPIPPQSGIPGHFPPTTVRAVEQACYRQHQYIQQMRPLAEVIGGGNYFFLQDSELDSPDIGGIPGFQQPNDGLNPNQGSTQPMNQQQPPAPSLPMPPQHGVGVPKHVKAPATGVGPGQSVPIPSQTFTNQSFPPIVPPPSGLFPPPGVRQVVGVEHQQPAQQIPVFPQGPSIIPISAQLIANQPQPVQQVPPGVNQNPSQIGTIDIQQQQQPQQQQVVLLTRMNQQPPNIMTGPSAGAVSLPGFSNINVVPNNGKYPQSAVAPRNSPLISGLHQSQISNHVQSTTATPGIIDITMKANNLAKERNQTIKENSSTNNEWDPSSITPQNIPIIEPNQWNNELNMNISAPTSQQLNAKNNINNSDWSTAFDSRPPSHESNHWSNNSTTHQNDGGYGNRSRPSFGRGDRNRGSGSDRGIRSGGNGNGTQQTSSGGNSGGNGGYRGRSNHYPSSQSQQNGSRSQNVYFRNNDNSYYQNNQNGSNGGSGGSGNGTTGNTVGGNSGFNKDNGPRYDASANGNNYRSRGSAGGGNSGGGNNNNRSSNTSGGQQSARNANPNRSNMGGIGSGGSGAGNQRSGGGRGSSGPYGSSRPQRQDVNA